MIRNVKLLTYDPRLLLAEGGEACNLFFTCTPIEVLVRKMLKIDTYL